MNIFQVIALTFIFLFSGCTAVQVVEQEQVTEQVQGTGQELATDLEQVADRKEPVNDPESEEIDEEDVDRLADATKVFFAPFFYGARVDQYHEWREFFYALLPPIGKVEIPRREGRRDWLYYPGCG